MRKLMSPRTAFGFEAAASLVERPSSLVLNLATAEAWILEAAFTVERIQGEEEPDSVGSLRFVAEVTPLEKRVHAVLACWVHRRKERERDADLEHQRYLAFCGAS